MPHMFIPITKVDEEKRLVYGVAACEEVDKAQEIFDYDTSKPHFMDWSKSFAIATEGKSFGNVRAMHGKVAAGKLEDINFNDEGKQIEVCAKIIDEAEWKKVTEAVYTGFSIGGSYSRKWKDGDAMRYTAIPSEISIVDNPCVPSALFTMIKMDGTTEQRSFATQETEMKITNDMVAAKARDMAKAAGDETKWASHVDAARAELEKGDVVKPAVVGDPPVDGGDTKPAVGDPPPAADDVKKGEEAVVGKDATADLGKADDPPAKPVEPELEQVWKAKDGTTFKKKAEAIAHNEELAKADDPANKLTAGIASLSKSLDDLTKAKDEPKGDEADTAGEGGDEEAKPAKDGEDKDKKKAKKKGKMEESAKTKKAVGAKLLKAATDVSSMEKGMYLVCEMARVIESVDSLLCMSVWESESERDNSAVPAKIKADLTSLAETLRMVVEEETAELLDAAEARLPAVITLLETSAAPRGMNALVKMFTPDHPKVAELLSKAGARHSRADMDKLQKIHDQVCELGANCYTDDQEADPKDGVGEEKDDADKLVSGDLKKALDRNEYLEKAINTALPLIDDLQKRIAKIESMPKPRPMDLVNKTVDKTEDNAAADLIKFAATNPEALATTLIKLAQQQPRQMLNQ